MTWSECISKMFSPEKIGGNKRKFRVQNKLFLRGEGTARRAPQFSKR